MQNGLEVMTLVLPSNRRVDFDMHLGNVRPPQVASRTFQIRSKRLAQGRAIQETNYCTRELMGIRRVYQETIDALLNDLKEWIDSSSNDGPSGSHSTSQYSACAKLFNIWKRNDIS